MGRGCYRCLLTPAHVSNGLKPCAAGHLRLAPPVPCHTPLCLLPLCAPLCAAPLFEAIQAATGHAEPYTDRIGKEDVGNKDMAYRVVRTAWSCLVVLPP